MIDPVFAWVARLALAGVFAAAALPAGFPATARELVWVDALSAAAGAGALAFVWLAAQSLVFDPPARLGRST